MTADMPRVLDRKEAVPALVGDPADFLLISGLAGTGKDIGALTGEDHIQFLMTGAMGAAAMTGFGLALAQPDKQVLVVTGDAELLMGLGALATIGAEHRAIWRLFASTMAITARPAISRAIPPRASTWRRWRAAPAFRSPAQCRPPTRSPTPAAPSVKAMARCSCGCG